MNLLHGFKGVQNVHLPTGSPQKHMFLNRFAIWLDTNYEDDIDDEALGAILGQE